MGIVEIFCEKQEESRTTSINDSEPKIESEAFL